MGHAVIAFHLNCDASAPAIARAVVQNALTARPALLRDTAVLLADEIVTNALVRGDCAVEMTLEENARAIRVEISDTLLEVPGVGPGTRKEKHGFGMAIVDLLASSWGVTERPDGKSIWFQLDMADF